MQIEAVDFYYLSMPEVLDIGDGSQDLLLVRIQAGPYVGWGECEASPLVTIASLVTPRSHSACKPVQDSVLGQRLDDVADIARITRLVRENSLDLLQADHALSGIDIALWDLLGKRLNMPVYALLGDGTAHPKTPYASQLFGDDPAETYERAKVVRADGYLAAKFGWGPYGKGDVRTDAEHVAAAREGLGADGVLLIDAGTIWFDDVERAVERLPALQQHGVTWLEEPFVSGAFDAYRLVAAQSRPVKLAGGEGCHNPFQAQHMIDYAGIGFVQIDAGRIGGITSARQVAEYARAHGVQYVNHTFTSHLALSASLQPYAYIATDVICEYPVAPKQLALDVTTNHLDRDENGQIRLPERPGLGMEINFEGAKPYLVETEISIGGTVLYRTPELRA